MLTRRNIIATVINQVLEQDNVVNPKSLYLMFGCRFFASAERARRSASRTASTFVAAFDVDGSGVGSPYPKLNAFRMFIFLAALNLKKIS